MKQQRNYGFKQTDSDQSYHFTIWGRTALFQTGAICGTRTEEQIIFSYVMDIIPTFSYQLQVQVFFFFLPVFFH